MSASPRIDHVRWPRSRAIAEACRSFEISGSDEVGAGPRPTPQR